MIGCIDAEHDIQDKKLNETYKKIMTDLNDGQKAKLKDAQRAWITYRDSWCAAPTGRRLGLALHHRRRFVRA